MNSQETGLVTITISNTAGNVIQQITDRKQGNLYQKEIRLKCPSKAMYLDAGGCWNIYANGYRYYKIIFDTALWQAGLSLKQRQPFLLGKAGNIQTALITQRTRYMEKNANFSNYNLDFD